MEIYTSGDIIDSCPNCVGGEKNKIVFQTQGIAGMRKGTVSDLGQLSFSYWTAIRKILRALWKIPVSTFCNLLFTPTDVSCLSNVPTKFTVTQRRICLSIYWPSPIGYAKPFSITWISFRKCMQMTHDKCWRAKSQSQSKKCWITWKTHRCRKRAAHILW